MEQNMIIYGNRQKLKYYHENNQIDALQNHAKHKICLNMQYQL